MAEQDRLRGCPTFETGLGLIQSQQVGSAMDPAVLEAQITAPFINLIALTFHRYLRSTVVNYLRQPEPASWNSKLSLGLNVAWLRLRPLLESQDCR